MKFKELKKFTKNEREKKLKELKMELVKGNASKTNSKIKQIKKIISKIYTINTLEKRGVEKK